MNNPSTEYTLIGINSGVPKGPVHAGPNHGVKPLFVVSSKQQELGTGLECNQLFVDAIIELWSVFEEIEVREFGRA